MMTREVHEGKTLKPAFTSTDSYSCFAVNSCNFERPRIMVDILGSDISMGVDTQASINALSLETFNKMAIKPALLQGDSLVYSFDGKKPIKSFGKFKSEIIVKNKSAIADFHVFEGVRDNLLS